MSESLIAGTIIILLLILFLVLFIILYNIKKQIHFKEKDEMMIVFQRELFKSQLEIQEQTLKNISQEIHDNIGQGLTLAKLNLNAVLPDANGGLRERILDTKELVGKAIADLRDLSRSLDTDYVKEMGLQRAIEYELEIMQKTGVIGTQLQIEGMPARLNKQKELILFRIVQETFHNVIKHAEASRLQVTMNYEPVILTVLINDNGKGMNLEPLNEEGSNFGLGIRNMNSRAKLIGAEFSMSSTLGAGTEVKIVLPIEENSHERK